MAVRAAVSRAPPHCALSRPLRRCNSPLTRGRGRPTAFASVDGKQVSLLQYKLLYVVMSSVLLAAGLYKCNSMGLLPVSSADWIGMIDAFRVRGHNHALAFVALSAPDYCAHTLFAAAFGRACSPSSTLRQRWRYDAPQVQLPP